jgi:hypothetical protein
MGPGVGIVTIQIAKGKHTPSSIHPSPTYFTPFSTFNPVNRAAIGARVIAAASPSRLEVARAAGGADVVVHSGRLAEVRHAHHWQARRRCSYDPVGKIKGSCPKNRIQSDANTSRILMVLCMAWGGRALVVGFAVVRSSKYAYFPFVESIVKKWPRLSEHTSTISLA